MDFIKTILDHAGVLGASAAALLTFAVLVALIAYRLMIRLVDRMGLTQSDGVALKAVEALSQITRESNQTQLNQTSVLNLMKDEIRESRRECAEKHLVTQALLGRILDRFPKEENTHV